MAITAIPTTYRGIEFRSRLEAKWAIMFDYFDWQWEYEPVDFDGYIPDFHIDFGRRQFFVEIKPAMTRAQLEPALEKAVEAIGEDHSEDILIIGGSIGNSYEDAIWDLIAVMKQSFWCPVDDVYLAGCPTCHKLVPLTIEGGWGFPCCRVPATDTGKHYRFQEPIVPAVIQAYWTQATNRVKYQHRAR
jgi:hypothetical protein